MSQPARLSAALLFACACSPSAGDGTDTAATTGSTTTATTADPTAAPTTSTTGDEPGSSTSSSAGTTTAEPLTTTGSTTGGPVAPTVILPRASIQPEELAVLANDQDPQSMAVAEYYLAARGLPADNLVVLSFAPPGDALAADVFAGLKGQVDAALGPDIQALAITWTKPYRVECQSLVSAFALGHDPDKYCSQPCSETAPSGYYDSSSLRPFTDHGLRPAMHLAGTSLEHVQALIDRGVAADGTAPSGTGYFVRTTDPDRSVRWPSFMATVDQWSPERIAMEYIDNAMGMGSNALEGETDILFYFTGLADVPGIADNTYLPGAVADHLTSYGGQICDSGQMSICRWLEAGATGSYGTATEPCNYPTKFPETQVLVPHYWRGETLIEAYWKSVNWPGEGVFVGEPLARPYAGATIEFDPDALALRIRTTQFAPGVTYTIESGPSERGPWTAQGDFTPPFNAIHEVDIPDATEPFYRIVGPG
ncbi:TIGR03790 family protein [Nannocystis exedens]|uniref:TIGR03790 family protein n=1 Tax=Nannocystis exedens TaxID=54 RepID=A0A1I1U759_9BACT|nr:TIGR03790 family protein [Nannocystis exedens]PCC71486.1 TIGR03790 family protein [Nannocystis exedens]SFD66662.1 TIGR03790 family protein [Nannocystis exedens]